MQSTINPEFVKKVTSLIITYIPSVYSVNSVEFTMQIFDIFRKTLRIYENLNKRNLDLKSLINNVISCSGDTILCKNQTNYFFFFSDLLETSVHS